MHIDFAASRQSTIGIEWELALVDDENLELAPRAQDVLDACDGGDDAPIRGEYLQNMIELVSGVHARVADAVADLTQSLLAVEDAARPLGVHLIGAGTHPFSAARAQVPFDYPRYNIVKERNAWWGRRMAVCGTHIHVGVDHRDKALPITNGLARFYPYLLSLSASSPYWETEDTGYASQRTMLFQQLPTNGLPWPLTTWAEFEAYAEELVEVGMIEEPKDIRWDVRPSPKFGTVENRTLDSVPTLAEIGCLTALTQCLVEFLSRDLDAGKDVLTLPPWIVKENKWRAARYGLDAEVITPEPARRVRSLREGFIDWLDTLAPIADDLGCGRELAFTETLLSRGASYERQRAVAAAHHGDVRRVTEHLVRETGLRTPIYNDPPVAGQDTR